MTDIDINKPLQAMSSGVGLFGTIAITGLAIRQMNNIGKNPSRKRYRRNDLSVW